jgi:flagellar assembly protein FliH
MTTSDKTKFGASRAAPAGHNRFIPREELGPFASWTPGAFGATSGVPDDGANDSDDTKRRLLAARQAGYQDGYRDGLAALDSFKQSFAAQMSARIGDLVTRFDAEFLGLERRIAGALAEAAIQVARQVVRTELAQNSAVVAQVAREAVAALLLSARHVAVYVHPDDAALVQSGAGEALEARGARLLVDATLERGGCRVESDIGRIDAMLATRWRLACAALGVDAPALGGAMEPAE